MQIPKRPVVIERYVPSVDWWVVGLVGLVILVLLAAIPYLISSPVGAYAKVVAILSMIGLILYIVDLTFFSTYFLTPEGLTVVSQLRRHRFPYEQMVELRPGNFFGLVTVPGKKRFALSANCLVISLSEGQWKKITVSPKARDHFVESLLGRTGGLKSGKKSK